MCDVICDLPPEPPFRIHPPRPSSNSMSRLTSNYYVPSLKSFGHLVRELEWNRTDRRTFNHIRNFTPNNPEFIFCVLWRTNARTDSRKSEREQTALRTCTIVRVVCSQLLVLCCLLVLKCDATVS